MSFRFFLFIALAGLFINAANAQKCKYEYEEDDPFSGKLSKGTLTTIFPASIATNESWTLGIVRMNNEFTIENNISLGGKSNAFLNQGDSIMFATEDGSVISCYANYKVGPETNIDKVMNNKIVTTAYLSKYSISKEALEILSQSVLTTVRINIGEQVIQQELKAKHGKDFMNDARCILQ